MPAALAACAVTALVGCSDGDTTDAYCESAQFLETGFDAALTDAFAGDEDVDVLGAVANAREKFDDMASNAPDNIEADVDFVHQVFIDLDEALATADSTDPDDLLKAATGIFTDFGDESRAARLDRAGQTLLDHYERTCA